MQITPASRAYSLLPARSALGSLVTVLLVFAWGATSNANPPHGAFEPELARLREVCTVLGVEVRIDGATFVPGSFLSSSGRIPSVEIVCDGGTEAVLARTTREVLSLRRKVVDADAGSPRASPDQLAIAARTVASCVLSQGAAVPALSVSGWGKTEFLVSGELVCGNTSYYLTGIVVVFDLAGRWTEVRVDPLPDTLLAVNKVLLTKEQAEAAAIASVKTRYAGVALTEARLRTAAVPAAMTLGDLSIAKRVAYTIWYVRGTYPQTPEHPAGSLTFLVDAEGGGVTVRD